MSSSQLSLLRDALKCCFQALDHADQFLAADESAEVRCFVDGTDGVNVYHVLSLTDAPTDEALRYQLETEYQRGLKNGKMEALEAWRKAMLDMATLVKKRLGLWGKEK
jgi:hypothetical protein